MPAAAARVAGVLPVGDHVGQEPRTAGAGLGQDLLAPIRAVDADGRRHHERPQARRAPGRGSGGQLGQQAGGQDPAIADLVLAFRGEPAADRGPGQVDHRVDPVQQLRARVFGPPVALPRVPGQPAHQPDDPVPAGGQQRGQCGADQAARAGDRYRQGVRADRASPGQRGQVAGELPVPVDEHGPDCPGGQRGVDHVGHQRGRLARRAELVGVPPRQHRGQREGFQRVGERVRRVVAVRLVGGDPAQPAGQAEHRPAVPERLRPGDLADHPDRRPGRSQPRDRPRPGMPGEHLVHTRVHHAGVSQSHVRFQPLNAPTALVTN